MEVAEFRQIKTRMDKVVQTLSNSSIENSSSKKEFVDTLNLFQKLELSSKSGNLNIKFNSQKVHSFLYEYQCIRVPYEDTLLEENQMEEYQSLINKGLDLVEKSVPNIFEGLNLLIADVNVCYSPNQDGGSISNGIGLIYLCPNEQWTPEYAGEMLVHEHTHNAIFLTDLSDKIFPDLEALIHPDAYAISAIRKTKREFDKVYHSICVVASILRFYYGLNKIDLCKKHIVPTQIAIQDLEVAIHKMEQHQRPVLTKLGLQVFENAKNIIQSFA
jgi:hypothetical protein